MCVKGQRGWILGSGDKIRWSNNEKRKGLRNSRLTSTKKCEGCAEVFEFNKLLQTIC